MRHLEIAMGLHLVRTGSVLIDYMRTQRLSPVRYMRPATNRVGQWAQNTSPLSRAAISLFGRFQLDRMMQADPEIAVHKPKLRSGLMPGQSVISLVVQLIRQVRPRIAGQPRCQRGPKPNAIRRKSTAPPPMYIGFVLARD